MSPHLVQRGLGDPPSALPGSFQLQQPVILWLAGTMVERKGSKWKLSFSRVSFFRSEAQREQINSLLLRLLLWPLSEKAEKG